MPAEALGLLGINQNLSHYLNLLSNCLVISTYSDASLMNTVKVVKDTLDDDHFKPFKTIQVTDFGNQMPHTDFFRQFCALFPDLQEVCISINESNRSKTYEDFFKLFDVKLIRSIAFGDYFSLKTSCSQVIIWVLG